MDELTDWLKAELEKGSIERLPGAPTDSHFLSQLVKGDNCRISAEVWWEKSAFVDEDAEDVRLHLEAAIRAMVYNARRALSLGQELKDHGKPDCA